MLKRIAGIIRKSPVKDTAEVKAIKRYKKDIIEFCKKKYGNNYRIDYFIDICSGDDEEGRVQLKYFFKTKNEYDIAICPAVDRWARSWIGLKWIEEEILPNNFPLYFLDGNKLYNEDGSFNNFGYLTIEFFLIMSQAELWSIRYRCEKGREKIRGTSEWKQKYKGRKKGSKNKQSA